MKRAERRRSLWRMKVRACKVYHWHKPKDAVKYAERLCSCSCPMCGNPRKHFKEVTRQEKKAQQDGWD